MTQNIKIYKTEGWADYELLDTGGGEKLERFGEYTFIRPYDDAFWDKTLPKVDWHKANAKFLSSKNFDQDRDLSKSRNKSGVQKGGSKWQYMSKIPKEWVMGFRGVKWVASPTPFRHLQFFPEQRVHWDFIFNKINDSKSRPVKFLNLFGYTGVASLVALSAGAEVTHVDASRVSVDMAKKNQEISGLKDKKMRVIVDDVIKFLEREVKRGNKYDAVIMDPPKFGRGPKGEIWKIENDLQKLINLVNQVLSDNPVFVILTSYALTSSALSLEYALDPIRSSHGGRTESGEMCIEEKSSGKLVSLACTAIWQK